jgi:hypothetical protein
MFYQPKIRQKKEKKIKPSYYTIDPAVKPIVISHLVHHFPEHICELILEYNKTIFDRTTLKVPPTDLIDCNLTLYHAKHGIKCLF